MPDAITAPETMEDLAAELERYDKEPVDDKRPFADAKPQIKDAELPPPKEPPKEEEPPKDEEKPEEPEKAEPEAKETKEPEKAAPDTEKPEGPLADRERDQLGRLLPVKKEPEPEKDDSRYEKAKKERARQESVLKNFEEEKRRERESLRLEREAIERERQALRAQAQTQKSEIIGQDIYGKPIYSSEALENAARDFEASGQDDLAKLSRDAIPHSRKFEELQRIQYFNDQRNAHIAEAVRANPDLANPDTPLYKEMANLYNEEAHRAQKTGRKPLYELLPDFIPLATEIAQLRLRATSNDGLQEKLKTAQAEIDRLTRLTTLNGASPTAPSRQKSFEEMTTNEQLQWMDRQARSAGFSVSHRDE